VEKQLELRTDLVLNLNTVANEFGMTANELLEYVLSILESPAFDSKPKSQAEDKHKQAVEDNEFVEVEAQLKRLGYA
jgi:hypothetical protein